MSTEIFSSLKKYPSDKSSLILHASDTAWPYEGTLSLDHDLDIYAEILTLPTELKATGRHIGVFASTLDQIGRSTIDVSGYEEVGLEKALAAKIIEGGKDGGDAGDIQLYVEEIDLGGVGSLQLDVSGGKGTAGQDTAAGTVGGLGGNGGKAGKASVTIMSGRISSSLVQLATAILDDEGMEEGEWSQMTKALVNECKCLEDQIDGFPDHSQRIVQMRNVLAGTSSFHTKSRLLRTEVSQLLESEASQFEARMHANISYSGGSYGTGGTGTGGPSKNGLKGQSTPPKITYLFPRSDMLRQLDMPIAHPDQCTMVLYQAKLDYFIGSPESLQRCCRQLVKLRDRLLFLDGLVKSDPIYIAYDKAEVRMNILPRLSRKRDDELLSIIALREISRQVDFLLSQLTAGLDFHGHKSEWVPRGSYKFYDTVTTSLLKHVKATEEAYTKYSKENTETHEKLAAIRGMRDEARNSEAAAKQFVDALKPVLCETITTIGELDSHMKDCKSVLLEKMKTQTQKIKDCSAEIGADFEDVIEACTMVAFCPDPAMAVIQTVGLTYKASKMNDIEKDDGTMINQEVLVKKMTTLNKGTAALIQGYQESKSDTNHVDLDDPGADKLISTKDDFLELVEDYKKILGEKDVDDIKALFFSFIEATTSRNTQVLRYNATVNLLAKKRHEIQCSRREMSDLSDKALATIQPDLPTISLYMERAYSEALWTLIEMLSMTQRALNFGTLSSTDYISNALSGDPRPILNADLLESVGVEILKGYASAVETKGNKPQTFDSIKHNLSDMELKRWKRQANMKTIVKIPAARAGMTVDETPFAEKGNVRLHTVRFFLEGAKCTRSTLLVILTHLGEETIVDIHDEPHDFVHDQVMVHFQYNLENKSYTGPDTVDGTIGQKSVDGDTYALVGPFASWLLEIKASANPGVRLQDVTKAWFEFSGEFEPLRAAARKPGVKKG